MASYKTFLKIPKTKREKIIAWVCFCIVLFVLLIFIGSCKNNSNRSKSPGQSHSAKEQAERGSENVMFIILPNNIKLEMVKVEPGTFTFGKHNNTYYSEVNTIQYQKTLTKPFYIGKYEVTNEQWCAIMGVSTPPSKMNKGAKYPIESVSWKEAMSFCEKMNRYAPSGWKFTLPTETQWEYAARGGNRSRRYEYSGSNNLDEVGWYDDNSGSTTHTVGGKVPNELGLYDMSGNVYEWCLDNKEELFNDTMSEFSRSYQDSDGADRVGRGGSWDGNSIYCRSASRDFNNPDYRYSNFGFRLALVAKSAEDQVEKRWNVKFNYKEIILPNNVKLEMMKVEPGTFTMSKRDGENDKDEVEHQKTLTKPFYIGKYEVTNEQWRAVMRGGLPPSRMNRGAKYPVESVSWNEAMSFCEKMNRYAPSGWKFTLPTETQWEYAARGGNRSLGYKYSGSNNLDEIGWYDSNSGHTTREVGGKAPNEIGLYDMSGNVWEWCLNNGEEKSNDTVAEFSRSYQDRDNADRAYRGGSSLSIARYCRSAYRDYISPVFRNNNLGFRLALVAWSTEKEEQAAKERLARLAKEPTEKERLVRLVKKEADDFAKLNGKEIILPNNVKLEMVKVEPGTFTMSKLDKGFFKNAIKHQKTLTKPFYIGKYEVTNEQWCAIMGGSTPPSKMNKGAKYPIESVSWKEAMSFCEKMNRYAPSGWKFTLPTETQWEYAARGGNRSLGYEYSGSNNLDEVGWYLEKSTHEVGGKSPNELGLYDMSGNVGEWCLDNWKTESYDTVAEFSRSYQDSDSSYRAYRGGCLHSNITSCHSAYRHYDYPGARGVNLGFRLALVSVQ